MNAASGTAWTRPDADLNERTRRTREVELLPGERALLCNRGLSPSWHTATGSRCPSACLSHSLIYSRSARARSAAPNVTLARSSAQLLAWLRRAASRRRAASVPLQRRQQRAGRTGRPCPKWIPAMITWPELLCQTEDWAKRFSTGAAVASLIMIVGTAMMLFVRAT
jgi:hypothetical protein